MDKLVKASLSEQIYDQIRKEIILQKIPCGRKLTLRELQDRFQVSNTPIREAMSRLYQDGLIDLITNQGVSVIEFKKKDILEINDICVLHDCHAIKLSMERPEEFIVELEADLKRHLDHQAMLSENNLFDDDWYYQNHFHSAFYEYAQNSRLTALKTQYGGQFSLLISRFVSDLNSYAKAEEHGAIFEAVKQRNPDLAIQKMQEHFEVGKKVLLDIYKND